MASLRIGDHLIVAAATAVPGVDGCPGVLPPDAPPTLIDIRRVTPTMSSWNDFVQEINVGGPIRSVEPVPRSDGAWLVYQTGENVTDSSPVFGMILDMDGKPVSGQAIELVPAGRAAFAAAAHGDGLALVRLDTPGFSPIWASLVDGSGAHLGELNISPDTSALTLAPLALQAGPASNEWIVAWVGALPTTDGDPKQIHLARFACSLGMP